MFGFIANFIQGNEIVDLYLKSTIWHALCFYMSMMKALENTNTNRVEFLGAFAHLAVELKTEVFRKSIHIASAFVPLLASFNRPFTMILVASGTLLYTWAEAMRLQGKEVPVLSVITRKASRSRDAGKFVMGPVTLGIGILIALLFYPNIAAAIAIYALAFGDGFASLIGKFFGTIRIPFTGGKSVEGSFACFIAVFASSYVVTRSIPVSVTLAVIATIVEVLPLKDLDNLLIPATVGFATVVLLNL